VSLTPFLFAAAADDGEVRPFGAALPVHAAPPARSPWTPSPGPDAAGGPTAPGEALVAAARAEAAKLRAEASEAGRAEGLREIEAQHARLAGLVDELGRARDARDASLADHIAGAAIAVIEAWLGRAVTGAERFAPIVRGWLAAGPQAGAIARVNPAEVGAMRAAIGDAPITVAADPSLPAGDVRITAGARELHHAWTDRLGELREAIAASVVAAGASPAEPGAMPDPVDAA